MLIALFALQIFSAPPDWLETDWLLSYFGKQRRRAVSKYEYFVREGIGLPSVWDG
jgi:putative transposase